MCNNYIVHGLDSLSDGFSCGSLGEADVSFVWLCVIDASLVWYEVGSSPEDVCGFVQPLGVDRHVKALYVTPFGLLVFLKSLHMSKSYSYNVVISRKLLHGLHYDGL